MKQEQVVNKLRGIATSVEELITRTIAKTQNVNANVDEGEVQDELISIMDKAFPTGVEYKRKEEDDENKTENGVD